MIEVVELGLERSEEPCWEDVVAGDGLLYPDGALFIVESVGVIDRTHVSFMVRCVVPPELGSFETGHAGGLGRPRNASLASMGITLVKGNA